MLKINEIHQGENQDLLPLIDSNSIDLTITSPPYSDQRDYHGFTVDFPLTISELYRVTKPGGVAVWVEGDKVSNGCQSGESYRHFQMFIAAGFLGKTMIYMKDGAIPCGKRIYQNQFEFMFVFSKGRNKTFNPIMEPCLTIGQTHNTGTKRKRNGEMQEVTRQPVMDVKIKGDVWIYGVGYGKTTKDKEAFMHPAMFPEDLAADHIYSWSNPGDLILDPFSGAGTVGKMAKLMGRDWIGIECSPKYCEYSRRRIAEANPGNLFNFDRFSRKKEEKQRKLIEM